MSASLSPRFLADLSQVCAALRPPIFSAAFLLDLANVYTPFQSTVLTDAFRSHLSEVHAALSAESDANLDFLANRFRDWRKAAEEFVRTHLKDLDADDPLRCPISLFRTMDYGRLETAHTRALAWLLDPRKHEEHGFGNSLLAAFIGQLPNVDPFDRLEVEHVAGEHPLEGSDASGRFDVFAKGQWVTTGQRTSWLLVIEAKIDAWEGDGQLEKYDEWLKSHAEGRRILRVFLTADGRTAEDAPDDWTTMSFLQLVQIFRKVYPRLKSAAGFHFMRFYLAGVLQDICGWPRNFQSEGTDPYSVASYLKTVQKTQEGATHDSTR